PDLLQRLQRNGVAFLGSLAYERHRQSREIAAGHLGEHGLLAIRHGLLDGAEERGLADDRFPAAPVAAVALAAIRVDRHVPELTGEPGFPPEDLPVADHAAAKPNADAHIEHVVAALRHPEV